MMHTRNGRVVLTYYWPSSGLRMRIMLHELFDDTMPRILAMLIRAHGECEVVEAREAMSAPNIHHDWRRRLEIVEAAKKLAKEMGEAA